MINLKSMENGKYRTNAVAVWGGMECTINRVRDQYDDQLDHSGHKIRDNDIRTFAALGLEKMRYPILWEAHEQVKNGIIDWSPTEVKLNDLRASGTGVIAGLVHHGSGPVHVEITDESFAAGLAAYASQVARKFPWIEYYTPVNEPLTTARFCGLYGLWYPHGQSDTFFCRILINECKATILAMAAIRTVNPAAKLVQTEDLGKIHSSKLLHYQATFENQRRWLSYDLLCGRVDPEHPLYAYLTQNGIMAKELTFFCANPCPPDIIGVNYYLTSERYLDENLFEYPLHTHGGNNRHNYADVEVVRVAGAKPAGLQTLLIEVWERYGIPLAVTEVHLHCTREEQMRWLYETWRIANDLSNNGVPVIAITPWALLGSFGWDQLLTRPGGNYESGIFDISNGLPRATVLADMIRAFSQKKGFYHPVLQQPGWWHRECRIAYSQQNSSEPQKVNLSSDLGPYLRISGKWLAELAAICRLRALDFRINTKSADKTQHYWAEINADEWMEIKVPDRDDLIIYLAADHDPRQIMNNALDLLLDGATGEWEIHAMGTIYKKLPDISPVHHFLAS